VAYTRTPFRLAYFNLLPSLDMPKNLNPADAYREYMRFILYAKLIQVNRQGSAKERAQKGTSTPNYVLILEVVDIFLQQNKAGRAKVRDLALVKKDTTGILIFELLYLCLTTHRSRGCHSRT